MGPSVAVRKLQDLVSRTCCLYRIGRKVLLSVNRHRAVFSTMNPRDIQRGRTEDAGLICTVLSLSVAEQVMYSYLDRLLNLALPRVRDFRGVSKGGFDGRGNYSMGLAEQTMYPEIQFDQIDQTRGMDISIVTTAKTDQEAQRLLELMGMPFKEGPAPVKDPRAKGRGRGRGGGKGGKQQTKAKKKK